MSESATKLVASASRLESVSPSVGEAGQWASGQQSVAMLSLSVSVVQLERKLVWASVSLALELKGQAQPQALEKPQGCGLLSA